MDWFPWYPEIYAANTMHLTAEQDGIYRRLIDHYMTTRQPLPDNDAALSRIAGVTSECWTHASRIVRAYFTHGNGNVLHHKFCDQQLDAQDNRSKSRSHSASIAAKKRWQNQQDRCNSHTERNANAMRGDATGQDRTIQDKDIPPVVPLKGERRGERLSVFMLREFPEEPDACPQEWGEAAEAAAMDYMPSTKADFDKLINWHFGKFANYFAGSTKSTARKTDWRRAWLNWWMTEFEKIAKQEERDGLFKEKFAR